MASLSHAKRGWLPAYLTAMQVITTTLLGLRLITRFRWGGGRLGLDDLFIVIAWAVGTVMTGFSIDAALHYGYNRHVWDIPDLSILAPAIQYGLIIAVLHLIGTAFTKLSILLFYQRLVAGSFSRRFKWSIWGCMTVVIIYTCITFSLTIAACRPLSAYWLRWDVLWAAQGHHYYCATEGQMLSVAYASGILSVLTDFATVLLPAWMFMRIRITRRQRIGMLSVFGVGILVGIAGIVRTVYLVRVEGSDIDKPWIVFNIIAAGKTEADFGIICACVPSLKKCFQHFFCDRTATTNSSSNKRNSTGQSDSTAKTDSSGAEIHCPSRSRRFQSRWPELEEELETDDEEYALEERSRTEKTASIVPIVLDMESLDSGDDPCIVSPPTPPPLPSHCSAVRRRSNPLPQSARFNRDLTELPPILRFATALDTNS